MPNRKAVTCPLEVTLRVIDGRWKVMVIHELVAGVRRFGELSKALVGVSHRTLTQQLREMERTGIIRRKVYRQVPPKVEYSLTPLGETLRPVLKAMHDWGEAYSKERDRKAGKKKATRPIEPVREGS